MTEPSMDWKPRHVSITGDGMAVRIVLDDTDVSRHVQGYNIEGRPGQLPMVVLYAHPNAGATFDGEAHVAIGDQADPGEAITSFLANIDAGALESAALNREDLGGGKGEVTRAILAQLADWAEGKN
jgi:hypothetical protein